MTAIDPTAWASIFLFDTLGISRRTYEDFWCVGMAILWHPDYSLTITGLISPTLPSFIPRDGTTATHVGNLGLNCQPSIQTGTSPVNLDVKLDIDCTDVLRLCQTLPPGLSRKQVTL
ncbi:hypothetical protein OIN60_03770, partial [Paenibacillus sp. P96]|nr:hypothetical protein [Paenibacillus sp. P96]